MLYLSKNEQAPMRFGYATERLFDHPSLVTAFDFIGRTWNIQRKLLDLRPGFHPLSRHLPVPQQIDAGISSDPHQPRQHFVGREKIIISPQAYQDILRDVARIVAVVEHSERKAVDSIAVAMDVVLKLA